MVFKIKRDSCRHSGGTKYYQIYTITGGVNGTVFNWGKLPRGEKMPSARSGSSIVNTFANDFLAANSAVAQMSAKKKRGYEHWETENLTYHNRGDFEIFLRTHMAMDSVKEILKALDSAPAIDESTADEAEAAAPRKRSAKKPTQSKPEYVASSADPNWGQW